MAINQNPEFTPEKSYPKNKVELPTIGRVVLYYTRWTSKEHAATVADVVGGYTINLSVHNHDGSMGQAQSVPHKDDCPLNSEHYWDWMPYQKGQAAKTEQLQRQLDAAAEKAGIAQEKRFDKDFDGK